MNAAGRFPPAPPSGAAKSHTDLGTIEPRCTLDLCVQIQLPLPAQPGSWPGLWQALSPQLTYFAQLGLWGAPFGVHETLISGFNVLYLFGDDSLNKGLEMAMACLWSRWGVSYPLLWGRYWSPVPVF